MSKSEWKRQLSGISASLPTFNDHDHNLELDKTKFHISWLLENGISADNSILFIAGGLGEGYFLDDFEWESMANALAETVNNRVPTGIGIFELSARRAARKASYAANLGINFIQCAPPRYMQPTEDEIFGHYKHISDNAEIGIMAYNTPWAMPGGYNFSARLIERFLDIDHFVGVKWSTTRVQHYIDMIRLFGKELNFISNGSIMSIGYKLGATGFTDFLVNVAPRLSLHKLRLIRESRFDEFDELELKMNIDPVLKLEKEKGSNRANRIDGMGEGPSARLRLKSLGMDTGPHFPAQLSYPQEVIEEHNIIVKSSGILDWVDWNDQLFK